MAGGVRRAAHRAARRHALAQSTTGNLRPDWAGGGGGRVRSVSFHSAPPHTPLNETPVRAGHALTLVPSRLGAARALRCTRGAGRSRLPSRQGPPALASRALSGLTLGRTPVVTHGRIVRPLHPAPAAGGGLFCGDRLLRAAPASGSRAARTRSTKAEAGS